MWYNLIIIMNRAKTYTLLLIVDFVGCLVALGLVAFGSVKDFKGLLIVSIVVASIFVAFGIFAFVGMLQELKKQDLIEKELVYSLSKNAVCPVDISYELLEGDVSSLSVGFNFTLKKVLINFINNSSDLIDFAEIIGFKISDSRGNLVAENIKNCKEGDSLDPLISIIKNHDDWAVGDAPYINTVGSFSFSLFLKNGSPYSFNVPFDKAREVPLKCSFLNIAAELNKIIDGKKEVKPEVRKTRRSK